TTRTATAPSRVPTRIRPRSEANALPLRASPRSSAVSLNSAVPAQTLAQHGDPVGRKDDSPRLVGLVLADAALVVHGSVVSRIVGVDDDPLRAPNDGERVAVASIREMRT